jgi:superfamily II DNA/RNA helicase
VFCFTRTCEQSLLHKNYNHFDSYLINNFVEKVRTLTSGLDYWPKCVILTPTRELTHQIEKVVKRFRFARSVCLYGGVSREIQSMILRDANPHIVIATPGRLEEVLKEKSAELKFVDYLVIDEADRMLSMGYETAFRYIMNSLPNKRQTLMFSATWPQNVQSIANEFLRDYIHVTVSQNSLNQSLTVNKNIQQIVHICNEEEKQIKLIECLNKYVPTVSGYTKTIIFVRKKRTADELTKLLKKEYLFSRALHSNKSQPERDFVIRGLFSFKYKIF